MTPALDHLISRLHERGRLRVWSLVITIFGDAIVPRGGQVPLTVLQEIMGRLKVEPGALRTALSRLAADQWVTREKDGRNSLYALDEHGRHAFDLATRRIYAAGPPDWDGTWAVAIVPPGNGKDSARAAALTEAGFVEAGGGTWLRPETARSPDADAALAGMLVFRQRPLQTPPGAAGFWRVEETARAYEAFATAMSPLAKALEDGAASPLEAMAARALLIHDWRRIVLHDPGLPAALLPQGWPGDDARAIARGIYAKLARPSERWLDEAGLPPLVDPKKFAGRFGMKREPG
ncbi:PaaX family transcriptional regulator C-terminal domain-containing protein [Mesorhizobium sp. ZC-5]|uniref:PaaX family transcriptional regulator n=1 Tax=Mesorhizobium sp. ZC-5 TaxID=2986066 RepID=UPI0021E6EB3A|nr:PaaX family transcriptional regulator C-terminal domain-containing protein [Mesorhizobium sp. ZC-5]MCV3241124.1 phenylacetic acid degradation protein [Mesorhizobium sp. ZC-5]